MKVYFLVMNSKRCKVHVYTRLVILFDLKTNFLELEL